MKYSIRMCRGEGSWDAISYQYEDGKLFPIVAPGTTTNFGLSLFELETGAVNSISDLCNCSKKTRCNDYWGFKIWFNKYMAAQKPIAGYLLETTTVSAEGTSLKTARRLRLYRIVVVPTEGPKRYRQKLIKAGANKTDLIEALDDTFYLMFKPQLELIDEETIVFNHEDYQFSTQVLKDGCEPRTLNRGEAYSYATLQNNSEWLLRTNSYMGAIIDILDTYSLKRVLEILYQCPSVRQCWREFGNLSFITYFLRNNREALKTGDGVSKVMGISKMAVKIISELMKKLSTAGRSVPLNTQNNLARVTRRITEVYNPQIAENFLSTILQYVSEDRPNATETELKKVDKIVGSAMTMADILILYGGPKGKSYSIERLIKYVTYEVDTYQGIADAGLALQLLSDYYRSMRTMEMKIDDYFPRSLHIAHDIAARNAAVVKEKLDQERFTAAVSKPEYQALAYGDKEYTVSVPSKSGDLISEGARLNHCVGSYVSDVARGTKEICFMRSANEPDVPLVTLEVRPETNQLVQYRGNCNRAITNEERKWLEKWCRIKKLEMVAC